MKAPSRLRHRFLFRVIALAPLCFSASVAPAQQTCAAAHSMMKTMSTELPPPPQRMSGIGNASILISTSSEDARTWFLQGLNLLHDFWDYESVRAFEQSVTVDPQCAMCWWGVYEARSFRGDMGDRGKEALAHARHLRKHASPAEKLYIEAALQSEKSSHRKQKDEEDISEAHKDSRESRALRKLVALNPDDPQAEVYLAGSLMEGFRKNGEPKAGTAEAQQILQRVLAAHPDDTAANHYWIHAVEPGNHPELALESARKLGALTPASGHMVHMPGHIFYRTGNYESARKSFQASMETDFAYMQAQHVKVDDDWNYVHNMMYLIADLLEAGRIAEATEVSGKLNQARGDTPATLYTFSTRDGLTRLDVALPVALREGNWDRASRMLTESKPDAALINLVWLRSALLNYTLGMKALDAGNSGEARKQDDNLKASLKLKPAEDGMSMKHPMPGMPMKDASEKAVRTFMDVAAKELDASVLMAERKTAEADAAFEKTADLEAALGYHEPPYYIRPVSETRGDALLRAQRLGEARTAYEKALKDRPNSGYPLSGIAKVAAAMHDDAAATTAYARLLQAWPDADRALPQVTEARAWIAAHPSPLALR